MADIEITMVTNVEGLEELEEALNAGPKRTVAKFLRRVEMKASKILVDSAEEYAPYLTGHLEGDIHRMSVLSDGALTVRVGPSQQTFYGLIQELGDEHVAAQHWLENSARAVQSEVLDTYHEELTEALKEMKKG